MAEMRNEVKPGVTVITPSFKAEKTILRTVQSVHAQIGCTVEHIVIEDGVFDKTEKTLASYMDKIRYIKLGQNKGARNARNLGLKLAKHDFVLFLDSDDEISPEMLEGAYKVMHQSGSDICFCRFRDACGNERSPLYHLTEKDPIKISLAWNLEEIFTPPCAIVWKKEFLNLIGGWYEPMKHNDDGELVLRAMLNNAKISQCERGYGTYWHHNSDIRLSLSNPDVVLNSAYAAFQHLIPLFKLHWKRHEIGQWCFRYVRYAASNYRKREASRWLELSNSFDYNGEAMHKPYKLARLALGYYHVEKLFNFIRKCRKIRILLGCLPQRTPKLLTK